MQRSVHTAEASRLARPSRSFLSVLQLRLLPPSLSSACVHCISGSLLTQITEQSPSICRKKPFGDRAEFAREVLAALAEAQAAIAASPVPQKAWALPPAALFALQKYGCEREPLVGT